MKRNAFAYLTALLILTACFGKSGDEAGNAEGRLVSHPQVNEVEVITLQRQDFSRQIRSNGKLSAASRAALAFGTSGEIGEIAVRNGRLVSRGSVLARLVRPDLELALERARVSLERSRLDLYDRLAGMGYAAGDTLTPPAEVLSLAKSRCGYDVAELAVRQARQDLEGTVLRAPFDGRVADLKQKVHDRTTGPFCTLVDDRRFEVDFAITEREYSFVKAGQAVRVEPFASGGSVFTGRVEDINPLVDEHGQISVRASVSNTGGLLEGMNVKVLIEQTVPGQLVVPRSAVVVRDNMDVLFVLTPQGRARWTYVHIVAENSTSYSVEANTDRGAELKEGDRVIVSGNLNLADESEVTVKP